MLSTTNYNYKSWADKYPDHKINIFDAKIDKSWDPIFNPIRTNDKVNDINKLLGLCLDKNKNVFPYPDLVFNAFNLTKFDNVKVICLGQDAYHGTQEVDDKSYPEAMGLAFSVPENIPIPSSLKNIYKNAIKFGHIKEMPKHGNLEFLTKQGFLLINSALTVQEKCPNSHQQYWESLTDEIIKQLSKRKDKLVFVLWGKNARDKMSLIDLKKHKVIVSSHPSGLSCNSKLGNYPAFMDLDQFGEINKHLNQPVKF
jgi:uracil-DNA glycosylase